MRRAKTANPEGLSEQLRVSSTGRLTLNTVVSLLAKVAEVSDVVEMTVAEHLPLNAENLRKALSQLPILVR